MRSVSAREANQAFSRLLGEAESGQEIVITRRGRPVAVLTAWKPPMMTPERAAAWDRLITMMESAPAAPGSGWRFNREELYDEALGIVPLPDEPGR
jgi:prevent-host-death family protein